MSNRTITLDDKLHEYLLGNSLREDPLLAELRAETMQHKNRNMQIAPEQGQFMGLLTELIGARTYLEVGTFTGYSSLAVALAMPSDGRLVCCDLSEEYTRTARDYWTRAGVADRIDLRLGPATETLDALLNEGRAGSFDFMFIDADKANYDAYYEMGLELVRKGGLIAVDNVLWDGAVANPGMQDEDTEAIRAFNAKVRDDGRVSLSMVPIGDGLTLARRR